MRSICVMRLLSAERVKLFRLYREEETAELIKKVAVQSRSCSTPIDLSEMLISLMRDLICRAAFGRKYGENEGESGRKLKKLLEELGEMLGVFSVGDFIPWLGWLDQVSGLNAKIERVFRDFDHFFNVVIDDRKARQDDSSTSLSEDRMDLLDILLQIRKDGTNGICMAKEHIKAILLDMFAGATDTTCTVIEWAMTQILRHPEIMKKLQEEIRGIAGSKLNIDEDDLEKMRLHPPVPLLLPRKPTKDVEVGGYNIAAGTRLIPFGARRRGCPGATFAPAAVELVLANLLHNFNWSLPGGARIEDLDASKSFGMSVHKKYSLVVLASTQS
ncbi:hypothetical protein EZV62_022698 [Acer yangbiense]|uniref:Cytochrome P450 n=1 Tax=Acer yangbiense TaxID=1000413 RepID=A0A5C7GZH4_9ROSI|nr:hypothetical protein EZV62_022698 [Acer yangbiense]